MINTEYEEKDVERYLRNTSYPRRFAKVASLHLNSWSTKLIAERFKIGSQQVNKMLRRCDELIAWHKRIDVFRTLDKEVLLTQKVCEVFPTHWEVTGILGSANFCDLTHVVHVPYSHVIRHRNMGPGRIIRLNTVLFFLGLRTIEPDEHTKASDIKKFVTAYFCTVFKQPLITAQAIAKAYEENGWGLLFISSIGEKKMYPPPSFFLKNNE